MAADERKQMGFCCSFQFVHPAVIAMDTAYYADLFGKNATLFKLWLLNQRQRSSVTNPDWRYQMAPYGM
jgi:hypothetical protein